MNFTYNLPKMQNKIKFAREGARVERTHCLPSIGSHSVGLHTFNMLTMLLIMKPDASAVLIRAVVQHDIPERIIGDTPHPAKRIGIINKKVQTYVESYLNEMVFGYDALSSLPEEDQKWLHGLDILEFYLFCRDQQMMGNKTVNTQVRYVDRFIGENRSAFPKMIVDMFYEIQTSEWETLPDQGGL